MRFLKVGIVAIALALLGMAYAGAPQTIVVDKKHSHIGEGAESAMMYKIAPTDEIVVDFTGYRFDLWPNRDEPKPDTINIVIDNQRQYYFKFRPSTTRHILSKQNLVPRSGMLPFEGFKNGDKFIVAIGTIKVDHVKREEAFRVHWVGMGDVGR